jgi:hypothetical protein
MVASHLLLSHRKELCARILLVQGIEAVQDLAPEATVRDAVRRFHTSFEDLLVERLRVSHDAVRLDTFVNELFEEASKGGPVSILRDHPQINDKFFETVDLLRSDRFDIVCDNCASKANSAVCGGYNDDNTVTLCGHCIRPLKSFFEVVISVAEIYHKEHLQNSVFSLPRVFFSTAYSNEKPHGLAVDYRIGGDVKFHGVRLSEITLTIAVRDFDWKSYLATPYVLFHEAIAHVYADSLQVPGVSVGPRELPSDDASFAEGWMDYVAFLVMQEFFEGRGCAVRCPLGECATFVLEHLNEGNLFHGARHDCNGSLNGKAQEKAHKRARGKICAQKVLALLKRLPESQADSYSHFFRLSFRLNVENREAAVKNRLVSVLNTELPPADLLSHPDRVNTPVMVALRSYLVHDDLERFIEEILSEFSS